MNRSTKMRPDFLIVGAPRSGTTSLNHYLRQHPEVHMARVKEVRFFDEHWDLGLDWYLGHFNPAPGQKVGEASPHYLYDRNALERIGETLPEARLIVILRNPVDQTYSRYLMAHTRNRNRDLRPFSQAIQDYIVGGQYIQHLRQLPDSPLLVLLTEELAKNPAAVFAELCRFLGVDDSYRPPDLGRVVNRHFEPRSHLLRRITKRGPKPLKDAIAKVNNRVAEPTPMEADIRASLEQHFAAYNRELARWLNRDLSVWSVHNS